MDPVFNPYSPGAGAQPAAFVGRDEELGAWDVSMQRIERERTDQPLVLYGLRGVGKTVLLSEFRRRAVQHEWIVAQIEAGVGKSLRELLGEALYEPLMDIARPHAGERIIKALKTALSFKASYESSGTWTFGLDLSGSSGGGADTGNLDTDLRKLIRDLGGAAGSRGVGVAVLVDEAQDIAPEELAALCAVAHTAVQDRWPVLFGFAGLPSLPQIMTEAKSYTERFRYAPIHKLTRSAAAEALERPAREEGVAWDPEAVGHLLEASERYPYYLQQFGQESWNAASDGTITYRDAQLGVVEGMRHLDNGFFRARWDRATRKEQEYMRAMSDGGQEGCGSSEVAARLGRAMTSLGPVRAGLIHKGLIYAPEHGRVAFTVPGMAEFILRQPQ